MSSDLSHPSVSLRFSLSDNPRTQIHDWFEDLSAKARGLCSAQWDSTGAITLIATDAVWQAIPGHTTRPATAIVYKVRPDYTPPAALDPAATAVDLANWRLEMQMHFAYTKAQSAIDTSYRNPEQYRLGQPSCAQSGAPSHAFTFSFAVTNGRRNVQETCGSHRP